MLRTSYLLRLVGPHAIIRQLWKEDATPASASVGRLLAKNPSSIHMDHPFPSMKGRIIYKEAQEASFYTLAHMPPPTPKRPNFSTLVYPHALENMSIIKSLPSKFQWFGAIAALFFMWTLWSLEARAVGPLKGPTISKTSNFLFSLGGNSGSTEEIVSTEGQSSAATDQLNENPATKTVSSPTNMKQNSEGSTQETSSSEIPVVTLSSENRIPIANIYNSLENQPDVVSERPLILYAYAESETARVNLRFFIAHGLHATADFIFIFNGETDAASLLPLEPNIRYIQRQNDCYDIGAYAEVLTRNDLYRGYKHFIMLNASIRGPFLPYWSESCWSDMYLRRVTDEVKLVGMTANCWPSFHVQSMIWATDIIGVSTLLFPPEDAIAELKKRPTWDPESETFSDTLPASHPGINACFHTWHTAVASEIGSSALIKAAGYKLDVMMSAYHSSRDYEETCDNSENGDVLWEKKYYGTNVHPYETIFLKSNRDIDPAGLDRLTDWTNGRGYNSYQFCGA